MSAWESLPFSAATCFVLGGVILCCLLFLAWDAYKHREPKRSAMATRMQRDELMMRRLKKSVARRIETMKIANGR